MFIMLYFVTKMHDVQHVLFACIKYVFKRFYKVKTKTNRNQCTKENVFKSLMNVHSEIKDNAAPMKREQTVRMKHAENKEENSEI